MALYQYCTEAGCTWTSEWSGGTAGEDPALDHLQDHPDHRIECGTAEKHRDRYCRQKDGENITASADGSA